MTMKYSKYLWYADPYKSYYAKIEGHQFEDGLAVIMLPASLLIFIVFSMLMTVTIPTDVTRTSIAIVIKIHRKYFPTMTHYEKCPCCNSEDIPKTSYEDWNDEKQDFVTYEGRYCANCKVFFHDLNEVSILIFDVDLVKENTTLQGYIPNIVDNSIFSATTPIEQLTSSGNVMLSYNELIPKVYYKHYEKAKKKLKIEPQFG